MNENNETNRYVYKQMLLKLLLYTLYISFICLILGQIQAIADFNYTLHEIMYLPVNAAIFLVPIEFAVFIYYRVRWRKEIREEQVKKRHWGLRRGLTVVLLLLPLCYFVYFTGGMHTSGVYSDISKEQEGNGYFIILENKKIKCSKNEYKLIDSRKEYLISFDWNKFFPNGGRMTDIDLSAKSKTIIENGTGALKEISQEITVQTPVTLSNNNMYPLNGKNEYLRLKLINGRYYEDWNPGAYMGTIWEGQFYVELADESGKTIAETNISQMFVEPLIFKSPFNIEFDDYNGDGDLDFTIGQYASSNGRTYKIFTLRKDGKVEQLPVKEHPDLFITKSTGYYSTKLKKVNSTSFEIEYYNNAEGSFRGSYSWEGEEFVLKNSHKVDGESAPADTGN